MIPAVSLSNAVCRSSHDSVDRVNDILFKIIANRPDNIALVLIPVSEIAPEVVRFCCPLVCIALHIRIVKAVDSGYSQKNGYTMLLRQVEKPVNVREVRLIRGGDIGVVRERITVHFRSPRSVEVNPDCIDSILFTA